MPDADHKYTAQEEAAMAVIRRWCDEGWTKGTSRSRTSSSTRISRSTAPAARSIEPGVEGLKQLILDWRTGFPDAVQRVDQMMAVGDTVMRPADLGGHPPRATSWGHARDGKKVSVETIGIDRVVDGKVVEGWGQLDMLRPVHDDRRRSGPRRTAGR